MNKKTRRLLENVFIVWIVLYGCSQNGGQQNLELNSTHAIVLADEVISPTLLTSTKLPNQLVSYPTYIGFTLPPPDSTNTELEYKQFAISTGWGATEPGICFSIEPAVFMEPGDFPKADEWLSNNVKVYINQKDLGRYTTLLLTDHEGFYQLSDVTGEKIYQAPAGSPLRVCYSVQLVVGQHNAEIIITTTSGKITTFEWSFVIVDE